MAHSAARLRQRFGGRLEESEHSPPLLLIGGDAPIGLTVEEARALAQLRAHMGAPPTPDPSEGGVESHVFTEERRERLAYLRQKYRNERPEHDGRAVTMNAPTSSIYQWIESRADEPPRSDAGPSAPHGRGESAEPKDVVATTLTMPPGRPTGSIELRPPPPRWPAARLPAGMPASSVVLVRDFWNRKLQQLTLHAGGPWPDEEARGPQFCAIDQSAAAPPEKAVPVYDFWNSRLEQLTFHAGEPREFETRKNIQFLAFEKPELAVCGGNSPLVPCYEWYNSKLKKVTAHTGAAWPDETRGPHDVLFYVLPPTPPEQAASSLQAGESEPPNAAKDETPSTGDADVDELFGKGGENSDSDNAFMGKSEVEMYENERWSTLRSEWGSNHLMPTDPPRFSRRLGVGGFASLADVPCPQHMSWVPAQVSRSCSSLCWHACMALCVLRRMEAFMAPAFGQVTDIPLLLLAGLDIGSLTSSTRRHRQRGMVLCAAFLVLR